MGDIDDYEALRQTPERYQAIVRHSLALVRQVREMTYQSPLTEERAAYILAVDTLWRLVSMVLPDLWRAERELQVLNERIAQDQWATYAQGVIAPCKCHTIAVVDENAVEDGED